MTPLLAFIGLTALLVLAPGMSTAIVLRNTADGGKRAGVMTALGIAIGNTTWAVAAGAGVGAILSQAPGALDAIRAAGALCLTWLGVRSVSKAWELFRSHAANGSSATLAPHAKAPRAVTMLGEGTLTNLLNPAIPVFYAASVPQFIRPHEGFAARFALLSAIHVLMALACHIGYAVAFGRLAVSLASRGRAWVLHAVTGLALIALAAWSALAGLKL